MRNANDLTGQKFGSLTVIKRSNRKTSGNLQWLCRCECGERLVVRGDNLTAHHSTQCSACKPRGGTASVFVREGDDWNGVI